MPVSRKKVLFAAAYVGVILGLFATGALAFFPAASGTSLTEASARPP